MEVHLTQLRAADPDLQQTRTWVLPLTHAGSVGLPGHGDPLPLTGSAVGDEGLTVAVFVDGTLTHVRHTRPRRAARV